MSTEASPVKVIFHLFYDFNDPPNEGGFYEVVLNPVMERLVHRGDEVTIGPGDAEDQGDPVRGRVRCLVAVVERLEGPA